MCALPREALRGRVLEASGIWTARMPSLLLGFDHPHGLFDARTKQYRTASIGRTLVGQQQANLAAVVWLHDRRPPVR